MIDIIINEEEDDDDDINEFEYSQHINTNNNNHISINKPESEFTNDDNNILNTPKVVFVKDTYYSHITSSNFTPSKQKLQKIEISYRGIQNIIITLYIIEFTKMLIYIFFVVTNVIQIIEDNNILSNIWVGVCGLESCSTASGLICLTYLIVCLCKNKLHKRPKINTVIVGYCRFALLLELVLSVFYLGTDTFICVTKKFQYANLYDISGDVVFIIAALASVILFNWISNELLKWRINPNLKNEKTPLIT